MRILFLGNFVNPSWDGSIPDEEHIAQALEQLGHDVYREQRENSLQNISHAKDGYHIILVAQWDGYPDTLYGNGEELPFLEALRRSLSVTWSEDAVKPKIVYWAFDYQADGQAWHERLVEHADLYLSKRLADSRYSNWQWLSQDFAPGFLDRLEPLAPAYQDISVLFTGTYLPWATERNATLKAVDERFNLVIHSVNHWPGFKDVRPPIMDNDLPALYRRADVVLSIDHTLEAGYWSDRNAQIMCCGARPLFRYVPLSEATFGDHVDYFYSIEDCLDKIAKRTYMENTEDSYRYAQNNLKVKNRVQDLLTILEGIL